MDNKTLLNQRWKKTDSLLKLEHKYIKVKFSELSQEIIDILKIIDINRNNINKKLPQSMKLKLTRQIAAWKKNGLDKGYFGYLIKKNRYTFGDMLMLYIFGSYSTFYKDIYINSQKTFTQIAAESYQQGYKDLHTKLPPFLVPKILTWAYISKFLSVLSANMTYEEYLQYLAGIAANETNMKVLSILQQEETVTQKQIEKTLIKQKNRILNVHNDKYSGVVDTLSRQLYNQIYINVDSNNQKVQFIAEIDDRTTRMCRSLDKQIFNTIDENEFIRWSENELSMKRYKINGLIEGINLPPINDHFHYCRSTITYQITT